MNVIAIMNHMGVYFKEEPIRELHRALERLDFRIVYPNDRDDLLKLIENNSRLCGVIFDWDKYNLELCEEISKMNEYMAQIAGLNLLVYGEEFIIALENQNLEKAKAAGTKDEKAFQHLLQTGVLTSSLAEKLCAYWAFELTPKLYKQKGGGFFQSPRADLFRACGAAVLENPASFFATEKFLTNVRTWIKFSRPKSFKSNIYDV